MTHRTFLLILTLFLFCQLSALKLISFKAKYSTEKDLSSEIYQNFQSWFNSEQIKERILTTNPGIEKIQKLTNDKENSKYIADLAPIHFPGLTLKTRVRFQCFFSDNLLLVKCQDENMERQYEGSKFFASIVSKLFPEVASTSSYRYYPERKLFSNEAELIISFHLPSWFPLGGEMIERKGSEAIQKGLIKDLQKTLDGIMLLYKSSSGK